MFETHKLNDRGFEEVKQFKNAMANTIGDVLSRMPEGRSKSIFSTKIEEAMFFGTKAFAADPKNHTEIITYPQE